MDLFILLVMNLNFINQAKNLQKYKKTLCLVYYK